MRGSDTQRTSENAGCSAVVSATLSARLAVGNREGDMVLARRVMRRMPPVIAVTSLVAASTWLVSCQGDALSPPENGPVTRPEQSAATVSSAVSVGPRPTTPGNGGTGPALPSLPQQKTRDPGPRPTADPGFGVGPTTPATSTVSPQPTAAETTHDVGPRPTDPGPFGGGPTTTETPTVVPTVPVPTPRPEPPTPTLTP